jgi:hypothetical protein
MKYEKKIQEKESNDRRIIQKGILKNAKVQDIEIDEKM